MKKSIVYISVTKNTELLANTIKNQFNDVSYIGSPSDEALDADIIFVGFWAQAFACPQPIKDFLAKLDNKKVFLFGTAGYGSTPEFFNPIMDAVASFVPETNKIVGTFICQGKVSEAKMNAIKEADATKFVTCLFTMLCYF
ncbi:MAG: hypothetical protein ATN35_13305 [Epulopiscium sp. Nele67-Bin004]|nr:MAG: hypothetical protein ATN35_13305 [Epulopiscium sp. Nele67-Bin004]